MNDIQRKVATVQWSTMHRSINLNGLVTSTASTTSTKALVLIFISAVITSHSTVAMDGKESWIVGWPESYRELLYTQVLTVTLRVWILTFIQSNLEPKMAEWFPNKRKIIKTGWGNLWCMCCLRLPKLQKKQITIAKKALLMQLLVNLWLKPLLHIGKEPL